MLDKYGMYDIESKMKIMHHLKEPLKREMQMTTNTHTSMLSPLHIACCLVINKVCISNNHTLNNFGRSECILYQLYFKNRDIFWPH